MDEAFLQQGVPDVSQFLILQLLERLEAEGLGAVGGPCGLELAVGMATGAQREPDPVLDGFQVERLADPGLPRDCAANGLDARGALTLLVGGDRRLPVIVFHMPLPKPNPLRGIA